MLKGRDVFQFAFREGALALIGAGDRLIRNGLYFEDPCPDMSASFWIVPASIAAAYVIPSR
ncbi:hypothetical protein [Nitrobacter hamburgensis]|uniref:hypothetical protein n=1 Tax=Nitrobacter hamburgensis TaxID=912 RepID=UPI0002FF1B03|nr:hypothetical protein [Nitrobacter hamburgensis]